MSAIPWLDPTDLRFPAIESALEDPNGLLAVGGDLSVPRLLAAYRQGIFPWYEESQPILWWAPQPRAVVFPERLHIARSLRKELRRFEYDVSFDQDFGGVIQGCAELSQKRPGTWISDDMRSAYQNLHNAGWAHSVEVWRHGKLIGGLYGVAIGKMFYGESMFSRESNASKIAFVHLCGQLQEWGFPLIDCQISNDYLETMGAEEMDRASFKKCLQSYTNIECAPAKWTLDWYYGKPPVASA
ncbi:leucyl/phenylalanyl-tRNA--protein transferase [Zhongshania guokunii]|uniref:Leucyl/phenylalanyl-tRNA--protein transferase n=1 Tax=Zhongshania guokunii TaxID=641783 RepID=A0ABV3U6B1_9GAMM